MRFSKSLLSLSIVAVLAPSAFAENAIAPANKNSSDIAAAATTTPSDSTVQQLSTIKTQAHPLVQSALDYAAADHVLNAEQLSQGASGIGDALAGQVGVYSSQFGGGASRPVIRGQDAARVKVLQNASETLDVSTLSPDHAVTVDPLLANQVEIVKGPSTLLYGSGNVGGLVNVTDTRIVSSLPESDISGQISTRYNSGNDETATAAKATLVIADQFALHAEGLTRDANNYIAPNYMHEGELERRVDNTFAKSDVGSLGLSWVQDWGFAGFAYTRREDDYGLPGHAHEYEECEVDAGALDCPAIDPDEPHEDGGPVIALKSDRYDLRSEINQPFAGVAKIRAQASYTDYQHAEIEEGAVGTLFKNKGYDARVEFVHNPIADWDGVVGVQVGQQKLDIRGEEALFAAPVTTQNVSLFALEHKQFGDVHVELSARAEHQDSNIENTSIESEQADYQDTAFSAAAAANWAFMPRYTLSLAGSYQERNPLALELYANGKHLATNSFEIGNPNLDKEQSANIELGLHFKGEQLDYHVHTYYNNFENYIYARTLDRFENFRLVEFSQAQAQFYGVDAELGYQMNPTYQVQLFGDYVRAKIDNEGDAPRIPGGRLGTRVNADFADGIRGHAEYYHVFKQNNIAEFEDETQGYNMVNLGISYSDSFAKNRDYRVYFNANNLLDDNVLQHASFLANIPQMGRNFTVGVDFKY